MKFQIFVYNGLDSLFEVRKPIFDSNMTVFRDFFMITYCLCSLQMNIFLVQLPPQYVLYSKRRHLEAVEAGIFQLN